MTIVLDPGHGGTRDNGRSTATGGRGPGGTLEKDVTLRLARGVAQHLGGAATLTRDERTNPSLEGRAAIARGQDAAVFVSLHANQGAPGIRGQEIWLHDRGTPQSLALSHAIERELGRLGGPSRGTWRGNLAVLRPDRLAPRTAACLVEVDYLSNPDVERRFGNPAAVDGVARAIARGIDSYLRRANTYGGVTGGALDYFEDTDQLDAYLRNPRAADTRAVSSKPDAHAIVAAFRGSTATSPWVSLSRSDVADRLDQLIDDSRLFQQGNLNLCGPAAFLSVWTRRDPAAFARFATTLFDTGRARIGTMDVAPTDALVRNNFAAMGTWIPQADWMTMGAIRNNDDAVFVWSGEAGETLPGITFPEEIVTWLNATGLYASVDNQAGSTLEVILRSKGFNAAANLDMREGTDIIALIQGNMVADQIGIAVSGAFLAHFSNHWVVMVGNVMEKIDTHRVAFPIWTFGRDFEDCEVATVPLFADNYYGAIVARMR
jgi:N-acetylmuramoyl-L-alanine amidase